MREEAGTAGPCGDEGQKLKQLVSLSEPRRSAPHSCGGSDPERPGAGRAGAGEGEGGGAGGGAGEEARSSGASGEDQEQELASLSELRRRATRFWRGTRGEEDGWPRRAESCGEAEGHHTPLRSVASAEQLHTSPSTIRSKDPACSLSWWRWSSGDLDDLDEDDDDEDDDNEEADEEG